METTFRKRDEHSALPMGDRGKTGPGSEGARWIGVAAVRRLAPCSRKLCQTIPGVARTRLPLLGNALCKADMCTK